MYCNIIYIYTQLIYWMSSIWFFIKILFKNSIEKFLNPGLRTIQQSPLPRLMMRLLRQTAQSLIFSNMLLSSLLLPIIMVTRRAATAAKMSPTKPAEKLIRKALFENRFCMTTYIIPYVIFNLW